MGAVDCLFIDNYHGCVALKCVLGFLIVLGAILMTRATAQEGLQSRTTEDADVNIVEDERTPDIFLPGNNEDLENKNSDPTTTLEFEKEVSPGKESPSATSSNGGDETPETLQPNSSDAKSATTKNSETQETKSAETTKTTTTTGASPATVSATTAKPATTSKPAATSKPVTTAKPATTKKPTTAAPQMQVINLPYNVYCNDTPETGSDEQYIKALYWNCYLRYYDLGQVNNSEIALQKAVIAAEGREHLKYEVMMKSDEFQCMILAGSCNGIAARPTIAANKVGSCASVNDYKFGGVPNASSIRVDHACNR